MHCTDITHTMEYKLQTQPQTTLNGILPPHIKHHIWAVSTVNSRHTKNTFTYINTYLDSKARTEDVQWPENGYHAQAITEPSERVTSHTAVLHYKQTQQSSV